MSFIRKLVYATVIPKKYLEAIKVDELKKANEKKK
tara:strand:+ start:332 stop:436 length:105 start_codon:yes stop_codon:yes gene_type:complete